MKSVALVNIKYWVNVFNVFRLVDGLGFDFLYLLTERINGLTPKIARAIAERDSFWGRIKIVNELPQEYTPILFDTFDDAQNLGTFVWPENPLLVFGAEDYGVPTDLKGTRVKIPMAGKMPCVNVACAAGIAMYDLIQKRAQK